MSEISVGIDYPPHGEKITGVDISQKYSAFQQGIKKGYPSVSSELISYHQLLDTTASFFLGNEANRDPQQAESLIAPMFVRHEEYATSPIALFSEVGKKLRAEKGLTGKDKYDYIGELLQQEAHEIEISLRAEQDAVARLVALDEKNQGDIDVHDVSLSTTRVQEQQVKSTALQAISQEPALSDTFTKVARYQGVLHEIVAGHSTDDIETKLAPYKDFVGEELLQDFQLHNFIGDTQYIQGRISELAESARNPDFTWEQLVKRADFPSDLYHSLDQLETFAEIAELAGQLEGKSEAVKAHFFLPYVEKGISGFLLQEMAEGRFTISDDFLVQQVQTFVEFSENVAVTVEHKSKAATGKTKKIIATALAAAAFALPLVGSTTNFTSEKNPISQSKIEPNQNNVQTKSQRNYPNSTVPQQPLHPENNSSKDFLNGQTIEEWKLKGDDLLGLYKEGVGTKYDMLSRSWIMTQQPTQEIQETSFNDITLTGTRHLSSEIVPLDTKKKYALTASSVNVNGISGNYAIGETTGGNYFIHFSPEDIGKDITITYSLGIDSNISIPDPTDIELVDMHETAFSVDQIQDPALKEFMQKLSISTNGDYAKLAELKAYIQNTFTYSLDPSISEGYDKASNSVDYFNAIFDVKHGDCDVVNTATAMLLRSIGIPTRLVQGSLHADDFIGSSPDVITGQESHAWVETFINGQWFTLDATPSNMDELTKKALGDKFKSSSEHHNSLDDFDNQLPYESSGNSDGNSSEISPSFDIPEKDLLLILGFLGISIGATGGNILAKRGNEKKMNQLRDIVNTRTRSYLGEAPSKVFDEFLDLAYEKQPMLKRWGMQSSTLAYIPPFVLGMYAEYRRSKVIAKEPYASPLPPVTSTLNPSAKEYLEDVLGYQGDPNEINNLVINGEYQQSIRFIQNEIARAIYSMGNAAGRRENREESRIYQKFSQPSSYTEWLDQKRKLKDELDKLFGNDESGQRARAIDNFTFAKLIDWHVSDVAQNEKADTTREILQRELQSRREIEQPIQELTSLQLDNSLRQYLEQAPLMKRTETETVTGIGRITPEGRRGIALGQLKGEDPNPHDYREAEIEVEGATGIQTAVIHWVDTIDPKDLFNVPKSQLINQSSQWLESVMTRGQVNYTSLDGVADRKADIKVMVHLVQQNVFGQYTVNEFEISSVNSISKLKAAYELARAQSIEKTPSEMISTPEAARLVLGNAIVGSIKGSREKGEYPVPLFLSASLESACKGKPHIMATPSSIQLKD